MNASTLRGLAAFAMLAMIVPRLGALPVIPLVDGRIATVTGTVNGNPLPPIQQTPVAPFAPFSNIVGAAGIALSQVSTIGPESIASAGTFSSLYTGGPGQSVNVQGVSLFSVTFQVTAATDYSLYSFRDLGGGGVLDIALSGPNTSIFWTGPTGVPNGPNERTASGLLMPGVYTLSAREAVGLFASGSGMAGWSGNYRMLFTTAIPDGGRTAGLFALALGVVTIAHRRRRISPLNS